MFHVPAIASPTPKGQISYQRVPKMLFLALLIPLSFALQSLSATARSAPESFADLVELTSSSVVNITTSTKVAENMAPR